MKPCLAARVAAAVTLCCVVAGCETTSSPSVPASTGPVASDPSLARPATEVFDLSRLDQTPVARFQARPQYPAELRRKGVGGEAVVDFIVDTNGDVQAAYAIRATHAEFAAAAVECVQKWKFKPGRKGGRDVHTHMQVPIVFTINAKQPAN